MNLAYQSRFIDAPEVVTLRQRADPALPQLITFICSGTNVAGRVVADPSRFPVLPPAVATQLHEASARAFVAGMDRSYILSAAVTVAVSVLSSVLVDDRVARTGLAAPRQPAAEVAD